MIDPVSGIKSPFFDPKTKQIEADGIFPTVDAGQQPLVIRGHNIARGKFRDHIEQTHAEQDYMPSGVGFQSPYQTPRPGIAPAQAMPAYPTQYN